MVTALHPRPRRRRAFALVDVIVATVLLAVTLAVSVSLTGQAISNQARGERLADAAALADEQLALVLARGPDDYARRFAVSGACDEPFSNYAFTLAFSGGTSVGEPYTVTCTISWTDGTDKREVRVSTLMAPRSGSADGQPDPDRKPATTVNRTAE
jgi:type II secretory pathway pseudopilin PulG